MPEFFIASHEFPPQHGGIATFTLEVVRALHGKGATIHLLVPQDCALPNAFVSNPQVPLEMEKLPIASTHGIAATWGMAKALKRHEAALQDAVLLITEPGPIRALYLAVRYLGLTIPRFRVVVHGSELIRGLRSPFWRHPVRFALQEAEMVATVSRYNASILAEKYGIREDAVVILPLAVSSELRGASSPSAPLPQAGEGRLRLITVARLHPRKGQDRVLRALRQLPAEIRGRIEYHIVGAGRSRRFQQQLAALAGKCGVPVVFAGALDTRGLVAAYRQADLFILTSGPHRSSVEGFGLVYIEANYFGLPVIGTRTGGTGDAIVDGQTGLLLEEDSASVIAAAIACLVNHTELRKKLGERGQIVAKARSWRTVAEQLTASPPQ
ncbi:MAG: glycosyltransferase [Verrucomicrobia bacterium]|jgi:glycosyltransferase involved in cell wall biosynthesis|nr:glycosyltransferase [Verrucomicrobiota bacterium]